MGYAQLIMLVTALIIGGITLKTVAPSLIDSIKTAKVDSQIISTEKAIFEAICRHITLAGTNPTTMADLDTAGFFPAVSNTNGFGGVYSFVIDSTKGTVAISTDISDATARTSYINSYKNTYKPVQGSGNTVTTTFVLPTSVMHGNGQFMAGIPVQSYAPSAITNKYWYDTSGTNVVLRMSDGTNWKTVSNPTATASVLAGTVYTTKEAMAADTSTASTIRQAFNSITNAVETYTLYNGQWYLSSGVVAGGTYAPSIASGFSGSCPTGFIPIPGSSNLAVPSGITSNGSKGWCVAKYEMTYFDTTAKTLNSYNGYTGGASTSPVGYGFTGATNTIASLPKSSINYATKDESESACVNSLVDQSGVQITGGHLVFKSTWDLIVTSISLNASNWSGGAIGSGYLNSGHNDNAPATIIAPVSDDTQGCVNTGQTCSGTANTGQSTQKRTHLMESNILWDWAGNQWERLYENQNYGTANGWQEYSATIADNSPFSPKALLGYSWNSGQGVGQSYQNSTTEPTASNLVVGGSYVMFYGAAWNNGSDTGVFTSHWSAHSPSSSRYSSHGFRCVVPAR
ncbi:MAG: hypothetical protein WCW84_06835 [Sulfurimonas sp.]|jgi:hypothetical protein